MPITCTSRFRLRNILFPYWPKDKHLHCCSGRSCAVLAQLFGILAIVAIALVCVTALDMSIELQMRKAETLVTLFGTFTIAAIGYSAWARQKLLDLRTKVNENRTHIEPSGNGLSACVKAAVSVFKSRIESHMMFGAIAYFFFLLMFLLEKGSPRNGSDHLDFLQVIMLAWSIPNMVLLATVGVSLNDFLDDALSDFENAT